MARTRAVRYKFLLFYRTVRGVSSTAPLTARGAPAGHDLGFVVGAGVEDRLAALDEAGQAPGHGGLERGGQGIARPAVRLHHVVEVQAVSWRVRERGWWARPPVT